MEPIKGFLVYDLFEEDIVVKNPLSLWNLSIVFFDRYDVCLHFHPVMSYSGVYSAFFYVQMNKEPQVDDLIAMAAFVAGWLAHEGVVK